MKVIFFIIILLSSSLGLMAQNTEVTNEPLKEAKYTLSKPAEGTYQIIAKSEYVLVNISEEIWYKINNERDEINEKFIDVDKNVRIRILPYNTINANGFVPLKKVMYEN